MHAHTDGAVTLYRDTLACSSEWRAKFLERQKWPAAPLLPQRFQPTLAIAGKGPLRPHQRAASAIADRLREAQLQTRVANVDILSCGLLKNSGQTRPKRMQGECHWGGNI